MRDIAPSGSLTDVPPVSPVSDVVTAPFPSREIPTEGLTEAAQVYFKEGFGRIVAGSQTMQEHRNLLAEGFKLILESDVPEREVPFGERGVADKSIERMRQRFAEYPNTLIR